MEKWQQLITELKSERKIFGNSESEKIFGTICIVYSAVQSKVNNKYDSWHIKIMNKSGTTNENWKFRKLKNWHNRMLDIQEIKKNMNINGKMILQDIKIVRRKEEIKILKWFYR